MLVKELLTEETAIPAVDFEKLNSYFSFKSEKRNEQLKGVIDRLQACFGTGEILSSEISDVKSILNRFVEDAFSEKIAAKFYHAGKYASLPQDLQDVGYVYEARLVKSYSKKLSKLSTESKKTEAYAEMQKFVDVMMPLCDTIEWMKAHTVSALAKKKEAAEIKKVEDDSWRKKYVNNKDVKKVIDLLSDTSKEIRGKIFSTQLKFLEKIVDIFNEKKDANNNDYKKIFKNNPFAAQVIMRVFDHRANKLDDEYKATLEKMAQSTADEIVDNFVYKNTGKIAYVVFTKNNLKSVTLSNIKIDSGVVECNLNCHFKDGSSFIATTSVVLSYSKFGKPFYRFPTTFHEVMLPDGSRLAGPSEQKMEEVFAIAK